MKKPIYLALLIFGLLGIGAGKTQNDCSKDVHDARGKMKPWEKGAGETGKKLEVCGCCLECEAGTLLGWLFRSVLRWPALPFQPDAFKRQLPDHHAGDET